MSHVKIIQGLYAAFAAGDIDTVLDILHPEVVWVESDGIPYGGTFIGRDSVWTLDNKGKVVKFVQDIDTLAVVSAL